MMQAMMEDKTNKSQGETVSLDDKWLQVADRDVQAAESVTHKIRHAGGKAIACEYDTFLSCLSQVVLFKVGALLLN
jgi:hypothetical protein